MEQKFCDHCKRAQNVDNFYQSKNLEKYPDGYLNQCKKCLTMHIDNWNPDTYLWTLQEADVPYLPDEWNKLLEKYGKDKTKLTGMTIFGRYLSKMKLKQFKDFRWADSEFLQNLHNAKLEQAMKSQGYGAAQIAQTIQEVSVAIPTEELQRPTFTDPSADDAFDAQELNFSSAPDVAYDLTEDEIKELRLRWGKTYRQEEWIQLEQLYQEMLASYDIQTAGDLNTLKLACKASLKANQLLDLGD